MVLEYNANYNITRCELSYVSYLIINQKNELNIFKSSLLSLEPAYRSNVSFIACAYHATVCTAVAAHQGLIYSLTSPTPRPYTDCTRADGALTELYA